MKGQKTIKTARYYNANGFAVTIVASITEGIDWAAYIGATDSFKTEEETAEWVVKHGCKLARKDAMHFFPDIDLPYRE
jgi:hypothetical protein